MSKLENVSTQELANELFSRDDWREAEFPKGTKIERGKAMSFNTQEEVWDDNLSGKKVWPVIRLDKQRIGDIVPRIAEGLWRTHADTFRQAAKEGSADKSLFEQDPSAALDEAQLETCYEHREENIVGEKAIDGKGEVPVFEISASEIGTIKSQNEQIHEAKQAVQQAIDALLDKGVANSREEALEMLGE